MHPVIKDRTPPKPNNSIARLTCSSSERGMKARGREVWVWQIGGISGMSVGSSESCTNSCSNSSLPYRNSASLNFLTRLVVGVVVVALFGEGGPTPDPVPWLERVRNLRQRENTNLDSKGPNNYFSYCKGFSNS